MILSLITASSLIWLPFCVFSNAPFEGNRTLHMWEGRRTRLSAGLWQALKDLIQNELRNLRLNLAAYMVVASLVVYLGKSEK